MDIIKQVCALLQEKLELFLQYKAATENLQTCKADFAEQYITQRQELANKIDAKNEEIAKMCELEPASQLLFAAANAQTNFDGLPNEYQAVFYKGQEVQSVIGQILQSEKRAEENLQSLKAQALEGIRQNKDVPKIKKYLSDLTQPMPQGGLRDEKA